MKAAMSGSQTNSAAPAAKKVFIKTWGCQMNIYDSERMADVVKPLGYAPTAEAGDADLVIFNTCHIREKATEKLFSELGRLRTLKQDRTQHGGEMLIGVAGCVAQAEGAEIQRRAPYVDMVFGPQTYHQLPEMIARIARGAGKVLNTDFPQEPKFDHLPISTEQGKVSAFLSIQEGCDKFCHFCVVPYTRGAEYSRPTNAVIVEAEQLVAQGARELVLLGQNVNAYHGTDADGTTWNLARLLRRLAEIPQLQRLRYTTSHPRDMDADLIAAHGELPQLMPFLHLPIQSGADAVLTAMNRKHSADDYRRIIDALRKAKPDIALSSDFIVGYPGESDQDFQATLQLVRDIGFAQAFSFKYSRRPGTPAAALANQVEEAVKDARLMELQDLLRDQQLKFNQSCIGKTLPILFENQIGDTPQLFGRSPYMQAMHLTAPPRLIGQEVMVKVTGARLNALDGMIL